MKLIQKYFLDDNKTNRKDILSEIDKLKHLDPMGIQKTNIGGWHSKDLVGNDKFNLLNQSIIDVVNTNIFNRELIITGLANSWLIINNKGHFNSKHNHLNDTISGCFYIKTTENSGNINFHINDKKEVIVPETSMLLLFPGVIYHNVEINNTKEDRIVYSFNIQSYNIRGKDEIFYKIVKEWQKNDK
jgi:hypothetical protein